MSTTQTINEKPILFNTEMVQAILNGRKTQTRRVVKPQPYATGDWYNDGSQWEFWKHAEMELCVEYKCSYGIPGDELWVHETFTPFVDITGVHGIQYEDGSSIQATEPRLIEWIQKRDQRRYPSIHMLREASRIQLKVTDIRVERVQDISEDEAQAEGVKALNVDAADKLEKDLLPLPLKEKNNYYRNGFAALWDSINAERGYSWEANPWCWVLEFEVKNVKQ